MLYVTITLYIVIHNL